MVQRSQNVAIGETHTFSSKLIGEFKFGFNRTAGGQFQQNSNVDFASQVNIAGVSRDPFDRGIPRIIVAPFNSFGDVTTPLSRRDNDYQLNYNISWFLGKHSLNLGSQYKRIQFNPVIASSKRGQFTFTTTYTGNAFADFLLGLPANARVGSGSSQVYLRGNEWQGFVQDDVKVSKRLTVNLGVRYEYASPLSEKFNRWATLDIQNRRVIVASEGGKTYPRALWVPGIEQIRIGITSRLASASHSTCSAIRERSYGPGTASTIAARRTTLLRCRAWPRRSSRGSTRTIRRPPPRRSRPS